MYSEISDSEYVILENIYDSAGIPRNLKQRDLSRIAGTSLGMTNAILKRLTQKGWITIKKLNSRNIQYAVTLEGFNEIIRRSYRYFKRTIKNAVFYKEILEDAIRNLKKKNISLVILVGASDLDFIIEHICRRQGFSFLMAEDDSSANSIQTGKMNVDKTNIFRIYAETITANSPEDSDSFMETDNSLYLSQILIKQAAGALN